MEMPLIRAWSVLEVYFTATQASITRAVTEKRPPEPRSTEEAAVREALAGLSYDALLSLLSDPRWYEPLPRFELRPKELGMSGFVRFAMMLCCVPHTLDALRAVIARGHNPPPLPPKPSLVLLLQFRWRE